MQNVNTDQSLRERLLRVGTVDFDTAGSDDSEFRFVGIASPDAVVGAVDRAQRTRRRAPPPGAVLSRITRGARSGSRRGSCPVSIICGRRAAGR